MIKEIEKNIKDLPLFELNNEIVNFYNRFKIGYTVNEYNPAKENFKNMLHLVAYDIRNPKRLYKVAKICMDFGVRVEYSVFECDLNEKNFHKMWSKLNNVIDHDEDALLAYRICGSCVSKIESAGAVERPEKPLFYIV